MMRIALAISIFATCLGGRLLAGDVIAMPLPSTQSHQGVAAVAGQMIMAMLGGVETGLAALDIPRGTGALEAAAATIAKG